MFQSAFPTLNSQLVGQPCSWCHTHALIKLWLISQFSSSPASSSLPHPLPPSSHFPCLSSPLQLNLFNPHFYPNCYRWTERSQTLKKNMDCTTAVPHVELNFTWKNALLVKSPGSHARGPQSLRRPWDWKMLLKSKTKPTLTSGLCQIQTHTEVHTSKKPVFFSTRQSISARLTSLP